MHLSSGASSVSGEASDRRVTPTTRQCFRVVVAICCAPLGLTAAASALLLPADGSRLIWLVVAMLASELAAAGTVLIRLRKAIRPEQFLEPRALAAALVATVALVPVAATMWWLTHIDTDRLADVTLLTLGAAVALGIYGLVLRAAVRRLGPAAHSRAG